MIREYRQKNRIRRGQRVKKIVVVSMVKNEADIIESFVRHAFSFADEMILADHMSSDKTPEILKRLQEEGFALTVRKYYRTELAHAEVMNDLLWEAIRARGADFVLPMDADEFLVNTDTAESCRAILERLDPNVLYKLEWRNYEPLHPHEGDDTFLLTRPCRRGRDFASGQKIIVGASLARRKPFRMIQGCHYAYWETAEGHVRVPWTTAPHLHTAHFHWRSEEQYTTKLATSWINNVAKYSVNTPTADFLKKGYHALMRGEPVEQGQMISRAEVFDLRPFVPPQTLRYSRDVRPDAFRNLLAASEALAETYLESKVLARKKIVTMVVPYGGDRNALTESLRLAGEQTYPYKEIFVLCPGDTPAPENLSDAAPDAETPLTVLRNGATKDVFDQLSEKARGDYAQWLFPGDAMTPDKVMKMTVCLEMQDFPFLFALTNGDRTFAEWTPYTDFIVEPRPEFQMMDPNVMWQRLLWMGKYPSGGVTGLLIRRDVMEKRQWLRDGFLEERPLLLTMFRSLLQIEPGEDDESSVAILQETYCSRDWDQIDLTNWIWHQIEWACLLSLDRPLLDGEVYRDAVQRIRSNEAIAAPRRQNISAALWQEYQAALAAL